MRIAHISATFPPYWAGTGNVAYHNARLMHERGHDVTVFTAQGNHGGELTFPFKVSYLPVALRIGNAPLTPNLLSQLKMFDIVHLHYPYIFGAEFVLAATTRYNIPLVITYHNDLRAKGVRGQLFRLYTEFNQRLILRGAAKLIATSRDYAEHSLFARTTHQANPAVLPNGVDTDTFTPSSLEGRHAIRAAGLPEHAFYALFVGGLDSAHHFKGVDVLIRAAERLPNLKVIVVGDGDLRPSYEAQAAAAAPDRVTFMGKLPLSRLVALYQDADVTVLPSTTQGEAFGMVLVESMACQTPVIASDLPGVRTVVEHEENGFLCRCGDVGSLSRWLKVLNETPGLAKYLGRNGLNKVRRLYDWRVIGQQLDSLYSDVLAGAR